MNDLSHINSHSKGHNFVKQNVCTLTIRRVEGLNMNLMIKYIKTCLNNSW
jgi:hypothetical protein